MSYFFEDPMETEIKKLLEKANIKENLRAENLTMEQFIALGNIL